MLVTEPVQATISFALKHYAYSDAIFLAERLYAEVSTDDSLYLLATCYYRSGKANAAYSILTGCDCRTADCQLLLARCCLDLKKYNEAEEALVGNLRSDRCTSSTFTVEELRKEFGDSASFAAQLMAQICGKIERHENSMHYYRESLKANPFLWSSYENLIQLGVKVNPNEIFNILNVEFSQCLGSNPLVNLLNANSNASLISNSNCRVSETNCNTSHLQNITTTTATKCEITSPFAVIRSANEMGTIDVITPENNQWVTTTCVAPQKLNVHNKVTRKSTTNLKNENVFTKNLLNSQMTPISRHCFGVFPLTDASTLTIKSTAESDISPKTHSDEIQAKKPHTRRSQQQIQPPQPIAPPIGTQSTRSNAFKLQLSNNQQSSETTVSSVSLSGSPIQSQSLRRSSRLFSSSQSSVKENTANKAPPKLITRPRTPIKRTKRTNSSTNITSLTNSSTNQQKESELNEMNKSELQKGVVSGYDLMQTGIKMQKYSAKGLLDLMVQLGTALQHLGQFECREAIDALESLPMNHLNTGWVLTALGRAYFEKSRYEEAVKYFTEAHRHEPHRLQGMEYLSTALWHLQREV
ncbi:unnamed protein product, partial [Medioppia subpectinata]